MPLVDERWSDADLTAVPQRRGFRMRGTAMTRLETFTDAAFAFAVTLLVISVDDLPATYDEFLGAFKAVPAFIASFVQLIMFWLGHRRWSELYGLDDAMSVWLSVLLIAGVLVIVYPLRMVYSMAFAHLTSGWLPPEFPIRIEEVGSVFVLYGVAFAYLAGMIALLYIHAYRVRDRLQLNALERFDTIEHAKSWVVLGGAGILSALIALATPLDWVPLAGWFYVSLAIVMPWLGMRARAERRRRFATESS